MPVIWTHQAKTKLKSIINKINLWGTPTYLSQHLHQRTATYSTRLSSLPLLTVPNPSTVFARRAFNYTAPTTWNSLPADILTCDSESGFKRLLFNDCFNVAWLTHSQRLCSSAYGALQICFMIMIIKSVRSLTLLIFAVVWQCVVNNNSDMS